LLDNYLIHDARTHVYNKLQVILSKNFAKFLTLNLHSQLMYLCGLKMSTVHMVM